MISMSGSVGISSLIINIQHHPYSACFCTLWASHQTFHLVVLDVDMIACLNSTRLYIWLRMTSGSRSKVIIFKSSQQTYIYHRETTPYRKNSPLTLEIIEIKICNERRGLYSENLPTTWNSIVICKFFE